MTHNSTDPAAVASGSEPMGSRRGIYQLLRQEIMAGRIPPGTPLLEADLANRYGMSRTPIREALRRLEQDGLVEPGRRGLQVRTRSPQEILDIYEVRIELEGTAAYLAAERRTELDLARLEAALAAIRGASQDDVDEAMAVNQVFQEAVWEASHNRSLIELLHRLHAHVNSYHVTTLTAPGRWSDVLADYERLLRFLWEQDGAAARHLAEAHMTAARDLRLQLYAARPIP